MNRIKNTYKRAPLKRHLCAWPFRSCLNKGGEQQTGRERARVPMNIFEVFLA